MKHKKTTLDNIGSLAIGVASLCFVLLVAFLIISLAQYPFQITEKPKREEDDMVEVIEFGDNDYDIINEAEQISLES